MPRRPLLTPAQSLVFLLVKQGKTNKEIAEIRGVSEQAVKHQVSALFRRFGVDTRASLIAAAFQADLDQPRDRVAGPGPPVGEAPTSAFERPQDDDRRYSV